MVVLVPQQKPPPRPIINRFQMLNSSQQNCNCFPYNLPAKGGRIYTDIAWSISENVCLWLSVQDCKFPAELSWVISQSYALWRRTTIRNLTNTFAPTSLSQWIQRTKCVSTTKYSYGFQYFLRKVWKGKFIENGVVSQLWTEEIVFLLSVCSFILFLPAFSPSFTSFPFFPSLLHCR